MGANEHPSEHRRLWRSRWAAIGAAVAVTSGGGGLFVAQAASSPPSSVVTTDPVRILDTRDPTNVGLAGPFVSAVSQKLQVTGSITTTTGTQTVVPEGATGVLLNVTAVRSTANGFVSVRPGDATGAPSTSSLNFEAGETVPNSVQVGMPTSGANAGQIDITFDALGIAGPTTDILIDVVGYLAAGSADPSSGSVDQATIERIEALESSSVGADPPCFSNTDRYVDCRNGTVHDQATGLVWLKDANCLADFLPDGLSNYSTANAVATGLDDGECGLTDNSSEGDWRLPTIQEWTDTVQAAQAIGCTFPVLTDAEGLGCHSEGDPFFSVQTFAYWSSTTNDNSPITAFIRTMSGSSGFSAVNKGNLNSFWPVRST